jgi:hypothetical protein
MLRQVKDIPSVPTTFNVSTVPGKWNASYDIWFDPTPRTNGPNTGLELMIWVNYSDVQPIGSRVAQVALAGANWEVWFGNNGHSNVASYRRIGASNTNAFDIKSFMNDAQARGYLSSAWYLTSVQAGFEVWAGGTGLKVNSFSVAAK